MGLYPHHIEKIEQIRGIGFSSTRELADASYQNSSLITFWGKKLELVDEKKNLWEMRAGLPEDSVDAVIWNTKHPNRIPITVYKDGQKVYWFNIDNDNVGDFRISFRKRP